MPKNGKSKTQKFQYIARGKAAGLHAITLNINSGKGRVVHFKNMGNGMADVT